MNSKVQEILVEHGLDFRIEKRQLHGLNENGEQLITPYYGLFNSKTGICINTCKLGYHVSQNDEILDMVLKGSSKFGDKLRVTEAGSINEGCRVYFQLEIAGNDKIAGDTIKRYVTVIDSNDGSTSLSVGIGDEMMHCKNQFFKFYKSGEAKFRHTATLEQKIASIPSLIEVALGQSMQQVKTYKKFVSTKLTQELANNVILSVMGMDTLDDLKDLRSLQRKNYDSLLKAIEIEKRECGGNNVWALFNGVTRFTTHYQNVPKRVNGRVESLINGTGYKKALKAFEICEAAI
jgi:hypothetical protein